MGKTQPHGRGRFVANLRFARRFLAQAISPLLVEQLRVLSHDPAFSLVRGDLLLLNNGWYVSHTGLINLATRRRCRSIQVQPVPDLSDAKNNRFVFKAIVYKSHSCQGFVGYGDADPSNVSILVHGAEMRVAETRAVNRALRKAYGIGICSVEEIGMSTFSSEKREPQGGNGNASAATVRDRLHQIIRQHRLDPNRVKAYASGFCRVTNLREANREQVEKFVVHLADWAAKDRNGLLCQLNSYLPTNEGVS